MPITLAPSDMGAVCRSAIEDALSAFPDARFELDCEGDLNGQHDSVRLHQLFTNLLVNAAKYGVAGEPVRVRAVSEADLIRVAVNNRGPAIPRGAWRKIFDPLVQLPGASDESTDRETSLGLGLYVAREIARLHGGLIEVDSTTEAGTTFNVCLPRTSETSNLSTVPGIREIERPA
jgi:signal transduction histidine kinase